MSTVTFPELDELEGKMADRLAKLGSIFDEAGAGPEGTIDLSKVKSIPGDSAAKAAHIRQLNTELADLGKQADELRPIKAAAERVRIAGVPDPGAEQGAEAGQKGGAGMARAEVKDFGQLFCESAAYTKRTGSVGPEVKLDMELKTLLQTSTGWVPETIRTGRVVDFATRPLQVIDVVPQTTTTQVAVVYMEETTFTNAAAETAEGATYPEATLALTEKSSPVQKIAVWLPVTDEQLEDVPQLRAYLNNRLPFMIRQRLDGQILSGDGSAPNLRGLLNVVGIQTQAKGTDPGPDAVYKAMVKVMVTGQAFPDTIVYNPTNWQDVRLLRTADGIYIWGNPSEAGPERMWGLNVAMAQGMTLGTALVGDFGDFVELAVKRGIDVQISNSHDVFFINGKQAIRADMRCALVCYRPKALCSVTGL